MAEDLAIWNALGQGVQRGLVGYQEAQKRRAEEDERSQDRAMRQEQFELDKSKSHMVKNPTTGKYELDDMGKALEKRKNMEDTYKNIGTLSGVYQQATNHGLIPSNDLDNLLGTEVKNLTNYQRDNSTQPMQDGGMSAAPIPAAAPSGGMSRPQPEPTIPIPMRNANGVARGGLLNEILPGSAPETPDQQGLPVSSSSGGRLIGRAGQSGMLQGSESQQMPGMGSAPQPLFRKDPNYRSDQQIKRESAADAQQEKEAQSLREKLSKALNPDISSRSGNFGQISANYMRGRRLNALVGDYLTDPSKLNLDPRQSEELAIGLAGMLGTNVSPTDARVAGLVPHTWSGKLANVQEWITSNPTGTKQQAFVKRMLETVHREMDISTDAMNEIRARSLPAFKKLQKLDPAGYQSILDEYPEFGEYLSKRQSKKSGSGGLMKGSDAPAADRGLLQTDTAGFPREVRNEGGHTATVSNKKELDEAMAEGFK